MGLELVSLLFAGAGASYGWWRLQTRRDRRFGRDAQLLEAALDSDAAVALSVAKHEAETRQHPSLWPLHLLYGLLQDDAFVAAIERLGGAAQPIEDRVLAELDKHPSHEQDLAAQREATHVLGYTYATAHHAERKITCVDLWGYLARTDTAKLVEGGELTRVALLFVLAHGMPEPSTDRPGQTWLEADRTDVHVVLRNDHFTTQEFVSTILREIFNLDAATADTRMMQTHEEGRAIVGRYKLAEAQHKIAAVRARAREQHFPLWIGIEDC